MGAFDKEKQLTKSLFAAGEFVIWSGTYLGEHNSADYGPNAKARVVVSAVDQLDPEQRETFVLFGVMAEQIERQDGGDFPRVCRIGQDGRANVIVPVRKVDDNPL